MKKIGVPQTFPKRNNPERKNHECKKPEVRGKGTKLGEHCPKVRISQDRMPIEPLTQQQSWVRGKAFSPHPAAAKFVAPKLDDDGVVFLLWH
jgi:hypothetical protein